MLKKLFAIFMAAAAVSCSSDDPTQPIPEDPPVPGTGTEVKEPKPKAIWFGGAVDFPVLQVQESIDKYLDLIRASGIDILFMDTMGPNNSMLCNIDAIAPYSEMTFDIFEYVLTKCDELDMQVIASVTPLCVGNPRNQKGPAFDSDRWDGKTQCRKVTKDGPVELIDIRYDTAADAVMLDPAIPEVRSYAAELCGQIVKNYSHHKSFRGLSLDYVRYSNGMDNASWFGYGDEFVKNFEARMGVKITDQNDFITSGGGYGKYFTEWIYFRSMSVTETIKAIAERVKAENPDCEMHLWASAQWSSRYVVGQNWATKSYVPDNERLYINNDQFKYQDTGFADYLDVFSLGAYANDVYISENPATEWTVENFVTTYQKYIPKNHKCKVWGSIASYAYPYDPDKLSNAITLALKHTDGMSVFAFCHVRNFSQWSPIKKGIKNSGY